MTSFHDFFYGNLQQASLDTYWTCPNLLDNGLIDFVRITSCRSFVTILTKNKDICGLMAQTYVQPWKIYDLFAVNDTWLGHLNKFFWFWYICGRLDVSHCLPIVLLLMIVHAISLRFPKGFSKEFSS